MAAIYPERTMVHWNDISGRSIAALCIAIALAACGEEPQPTSVIEFMENPILLDAAMVHCADSRLDARYDRECINAREAADRLGAREAQARREQLEAQSERKRQTLRRAQEAAAEARRQAQEAQQRREQAEYDAQFAPLPEEPADAAPSPGTPSPGDGPDAAPAGPSSENAATTAPDETPVDDGVVRDHGDGETGDLEAIRKELERRQPGPAEPSGQ